VPVTAVQCRCLISAQSVYHARELYHARVIFRRISSWYAIPCLGMKTSAGFNLVYVCFAWATPNFLYGTPNAQVDVFGKIRFFNSGSVCTCEYINHKYMSQYGVDRSRASNERHSANRNPRHGHYTREFFYNVLVEEWKLWLSSHFRPRGWKASSAQVAFKKMTTSIFSTSCNDVICVSWCRGVHIQTTWRHQC